MNAQYEQAIDTFYSSFEVRREDTAAPMYMHPENMSDEERMLELLTSRASGGVTGKKTDDETDLNLGLEYDWGSTAPIPGVSVKWQKRGASESHIFNSDTFTSVVFRPKTDFTKRSTSTNIQLKIMVWTYPSNLTAVSFCSKI